ncbi:hypothetical protein B7463_g8314, partial [Scytalidium lignicola]
MGVPLAVIQDFYHLHDHHHPVYRLIRYVAVWALFLGRILQGISGSAAWIVSFAILSDNVGAEHMGKVTGVAMSFITAGLVSGPMVAGTMLQLLGYWPTWCASLMVLLLGMIACLIMIEGGDGSLSRPDSVVSTTPVPSLPGLETAIVSSDGETSALLSSGHHSYHSIGTKSDSHTEETEKTTPSHRFYYIMFRDIRVLAGIVNTVIFSAIMSGFDSTLPLHLYRVFNWGSLPVGIMFLGLQIPSMFLGPVVGWYQDRAGLRNYTTVGWVLMAPLLWLLGIPGQSHFIWASLDIYGKALLIFCMIAIGSVSSLIRSAGSLQIMTVFHDLQLKNPKSFGDHGGSSKVFSITEVSFNLGMMLGPLLSGYLSEAVGYYYMNMTLGPTPTTGTNITFYGH